MALAEVRNGADAWIGRQKADISKLENGNGNPSLRTLRRLAAGMGMTMKVEFVPAGGAVG